MRKSLGLLSAAVLIAVAAGISSADIIKMKDGRQFEGQIISQDGSTVSIKTMIKGIYAELDLNMSSVDSIEKKDVPPGFFNPPPAKPKQIKEGKYMFIPFVGRIGDQIVTEGLAMSLVQASDNGIEHVVFMVDSQGGDLGVSRDIARLLSGYSDKLKFHAIVRDASGSAMIVPIFSQTVHLLPGAVMGGEMLTFDVNKIPAGKTEQLMRAEVGMNVGKVASKRGWNGNVVRAMFDPEYKLYICKTPSGQIQSMLRPPSAADGEIVYQPGAGKVLSLSRDQAIALKMGTAYEGTDAGLGKVLGVANWETYGDYGEKAMQQAADKAYMLEQKKVAAAEQKTKTLDDQRDQLKSYIESNLAEAKTWDPSAELADYQKWAAVGETDHRVVTGGNQANTFTDKADLTLMALSKAQQAITQLKPLEQQAATQGLKPLYPAGELDSMSQSINNKILYLQRERDRQSKVQSY